MARAARASIDLAALKLNCAQAAQIALALEPGAQAFGVACIEEALTLRQGGVSRPILLLEGVFDADWLVIAAQQNFWLMVENSGQVRAIAEAPLKNCAALSGLQVG